MKKMVSVHYSKCCFKLEGMLIITAVPDIVMHSCALYNSITVFYFKKSIYFQAGHLGLVLLWEKKGKHRNESDRGDPCKFF